MLELKLPTDPRWVDLVEMDIEEILTDHAYCEQKAASTGISLIIQFPELEDLVTEVTKVVAEEWGHFQMVLDELKKRGLKLGRKRKDIYVNELLSRLKCGSARDEFLLDKLLMLALIEARSCERFKLLSLECSDMELRVFYKKLMVSEAGHYKMYLDFAYQYVDHEKVKKRWELFLSTEAEVLNEIELRGDRMH